MTREELRDYVEEQRNLNVIPYYVYSALIDGIDTLEQEPSGDVISRQAVLNTLDRMDKALDTDRTVESYKELLTECYKDLPSVKQEPKTGHWIMTSDYLTTAYSSIDYVKCSCCNEYSLEEGDYCPNCGAKMVESEDIKNE